MKTIVYDIYKNTLFILKKCKKKQRYTINRHLVFTTLDNSTQSSTFINSKINYTSWMAKN